MYIHLLCTQLNKMSKFDFSTSFGRLLGMTHYRMTRHLAQLMESAELPLTPEQFRFMAQLWHADDRIQQDLAHCLNRDRANITRITDILERKGLLSRVQDEQDRRVSKVQLTANGRVLEKPASACAMETIAVATAGIDPKALETCKQVLRQVIQNLSEARDIPKK